MIKQYVEIITDFQAIHNWPECSIEEVSFLKHPHRHKIIVTVKIETSKDRQIEFFMLKDIVDEIIDRLFSSRRTKELGRMSMEEISTKILKELRNKYGDCYIKVSASEDGQVSGIVKYVVDSVKSLDDGKNRKLDEFM